MSSRESLFSRLFAKDGMRHRFPTYDQALKAYLHDIAQLPVLSTEQERQLLERITQGDERAKHTLVEANQRLVVTIATHFQGRGLPLLDLIQEGTLGLWKAIPRFDAARGYKFATYAKYWVVQTIDHALAEHSRTIALPSHTVQYLKRMQQATSDLISAGAEPTLEAIAATVHLSLEQVKELSLLLQQEPISLDQQREGHDPLVESLPAPPLLLSNEAPALPPLFADVVERMGTLLSERERTVIERRFGLADAGHAHTRKELAQQLGVSVERVRQMEVGALAKLRGALEEDRV